VIFINQLRMKIGIMFGNPETTPGGTALKFYSSVRIDVRRSAQLKQGDNVVGNLVKAKIVKNKVAPPFQTTEFNILYNQGIDLMGDVLETGVKYDVVSKAGASYSFGETKLGVGRDAATTFLRENPKIVKEIKKAVWDAAKAAVVATPITQSE
jgi:recombination protein RecA